MIAALLATTIAAAPPAVFVLGVDGMDPVILDRLMAEGKVPHLKALAASGSYQELATSIPPQSPVAWSTFVTGMNPGGHGIFDFVHRDPKTYKPVSSATRPISEQPSFFEVFGYIVPTGGEDPVNNRGGVPFWDYLAERGVDVEVYRIPANFPSPVSDAKVLAGMGTVDMRGGYGTYTWYTSKPVDKDDPKGDIQLVTVQDHDLDGVPDTASGILRGPPDLFHLKPGQAPGDGDYLSQRVLFHLDPVHDTVLIRLGGTDTVLQAGEWSDWIDLRFDALPGGLVSFAGAVRFYAKQLRPVFEVYASPVNIAAADPSQPISSPEAFATELYERLGHYYTQGMPEETDALKDGTFTDADYVGQVALVQEDTEEMLQLALDRFAPGDFTFVYLSDVDLQCHMLWRHHDPKYPDAPPHPAHDPATAGDYMQAIEGYYQNADRLLGLVQERAPKDAVIIVMSDHGFQPYTRKVHLNAWLRDKGYLALKDGKTSGSIVAGDVDWSRTRAYSLGFNAVYLNLAGREAEGVVSRADAPKVLAALKADLQAFEDPVRGVRVVHKADLSSEVYSGERLAEAPDLVVGYDVHYGGSDANTLGEIAEPVIEDNTSRWSGNHLMSADVVPGVILVNRHIEGKGYGLTDLTVALLRHYKIDKPAAMVGKDIPLRRGK